MNFTNFNDVTEVNDLLSNNTVINSTSVKHQCQEWANTQHKLYHTSNIFFIMAFAIPYTFKQSTLLIRIFLTIGYVFSVIWVATEICALDIFVWYSVFTVINLIYSVFLAYKFMPPTFTMELADLYTKVFRPLRVSQKHFKELVESGSILNLNIGDVYAAQNITPANEYLSILLKGRLKVNYNDFHLHYIYYHQFIDSPEWQANCNNEMETYLFQVSIVAEEESVYLCWNRSKLEKVLKHRPTLNFIFRSIVGKDITHKLYCLNENISKSKYDHNHALNRKNELLPRDKYRSQSLDVVHTNLRGHMHSKSPKITE